MTKTSMSIHRALAELKLLDKRIHAAVAERFVAVTSGEKAPVHYPSIEVFEKEAKASVDKVNDLIERRKVIKSAIIASNAVTLVRIAGVEMTVAEAIDRRDTGIEYDEQLLVNLRNQLMNADREKLRLEADLRERTQKHIEVSFPKEGTHKPEEVAEAEEAFMKRHEVKLLDPADIRAMIKKLQDDIEQFKAEVDYSLSESNTQTLIEV